MARYAVGVDFGSESGRAVLVDVADGRSLATAVHPYAHGVIDDALPLDGPRRGVSRPTGRSRIPRTTSRSFGQRYLRSCAVSEVEPSDVIGIGIDFTACTMLPTTADGTPLCLCRTCGPNPHAWVKLWKHHAAQPQADRINGRRAHDRPALAAALRRAGSSSEWFFAKSLQILEEAPEIYARGRAPDRSRRLGRLAA